MKLAKLPAGLDNLSNLQKLDLSYCKLKRLPGSFSKLSSLQAISLSESCAAEAAKAKHQLTGGSRAVSVSINRPLWAAPHIPPEVVHDSQLTTTLRFVLHLGSVRSASLSPSLQTHSSILNRSHSVRSTSRHSYYGGDRDSSRTFFSPSASTDPNRTGRTYTYAPTLSLLALITNCKHPTIPHKSHTGIVIVFITMYISVYIYTYIVARPFAALLVPEP